LILFYPAWLSKESELTYEPRKMCNLLRYRNISLSLKFPNVSPYPYLVMLIIVRPSKRLKIYFL
jgi:hypothetical protein